MLRWWGNLRSKVLFKVFRDEVSEYLQSILWCAHFLHAYLCSSHYQPTSAESSDAIRSVGHAFRDMAVINDGWSPSSSLRSYEIFSPWSCAFWISSSPVSICDTVVYIEAFFTRKNLSSLSSEAVQIENFIEGTFVFTKWRLWPMVGHPIPCRYALYARQTINSIRCPWDLVDAPQTKESLIHAVYQKFHTYRTQATHRCWETHFHGHMMLY
jgi:hypothetical protein